MGRTLMTAFARQLRGKVTFETPPEGGMVARLVFPTPEAPAG
jgi:two-component sensor histidine kinase